ncbi:TPA: deoxyribodipyrimidine photolyase, partial [Candidatus Dependentiae bacterium]|nr:deoxyribodipyrimidine photolyase [Candidatus Dependentiae bacterium]
SAHNKFGTASIRQVAHAIATKLSPNHELIRQLYWRDFFLYLLFHYPTMLTNSARPQYETKTWNTNKKLFEAWCQGRTGIPIIDAGIRELNQTGYIHNRVRMLTASFLVKNLGIDWRKGAQYFAQKLVDYDPAVNAGNWQWISSTGYDAQPYFRVFNPWIQQKKFDRECRYIKQWIPELSSFTPAQIHNPKTNYADTYPSPLVDTTAQAKEYIALIKFRLQKYSD